MDGAQRKTEKSIFRNYSTDLEDSDRARKPVWDKTDSELLAPRQRKGQTGPFTMRLLIERLEATGKKKIQRNEDQML